MKKLFLTFFTLIFLFFSASAEQNKAEITASFDISLIHGLGTLKKCKAASLNSCLKSLCDSYSTVITSSSKAEDKVNFGKVISCIGPKFFKKMYNSTTFSAFTTAEFSECVGNNATYIAFTTIYTSDACTTYFSSQFNKEKNQVSGKIEISETGALGYDKDKCTAQIEKAKETLTIAQKAVVAGLEACIQGKVTISDSFTGYGEAALKVCITAYLAESNAVKTFIAAYLEGYCADTTAVTGDEAVKALSFRDLYAQTINLKKNENNKKSALISLKLKISGNTDDNPCDTAEGVQKVLKMVQELGTNQTELVDLFGTLELKLKAKLQTDTTGEYCATVAQYLMVAEQLMISNSQGESGAFKLKVKSATNIYIQCASFMTGSESLELKNSKLSMKAFDPDSASSVDLTSGSNKIVLGEKALAFIKAKAGLTGDDEIIATFNTATKASAGLSASLTANITASEIVTAEFKKRSSTEVTDITIGSLTDNTTLSVEFSSSVETGTNKCVRLEGNAWVESGSFEATSTTKSTICLMNHASEYTIVSADVSGKIDDKGDFGFKMGTSVLLVLLFVLIL